jgi:dihydrofolate reductase
MPNILYMAVSRDGFIAGSNDETPWSDAEWEAFASFVVTCDIVLIGRRTYEIMQKDDQFVEGPTYTVATAQQAYDAGGFSTIRINAAKDMPQAKRVGIIGGGELNGRLAKLGVIDELYLDIEPVELHAGIKLFGNYEPALKLQLIGSKLIGKATIQRHYKVNR